MEAQILDNLHIRKPMPTRKLMEAIGVRDTKRVGHISQLFLIQRFPKFRKEVGLVFITF